MSSDNETTVNESTLQSDSDERIYMFNAVWFKPDGGRDKYRKYMRVVIPLIKEVGGRKLKSFVPDRSLIGEFDADLVFFVEYPSWSAFKDFANSPKYHKAAPLRKESIEKSFLVRCVRPEVPFR